MRILKLLYRETGYRLFVFGLFGLLSGILHAAILPFITFVIGNYASSEFQVINLLHVALYFGIVLAMIVCQRTFSRFMTSLTQGLMLRIRISLLDTVRRANYYQYEQIGHGEIYTAITRDATIVSNSAASIVYASTALVTALACLIYLAYLSWIGFAATILTMSVGITFYMIRQRKIKKIFQDVRESETIFFKHINELLAGFKEVKVNQSKNDDIYHNYIGKISHRTTNFMLRGVNFYLDNGYVGQLSFLGLIAFVLFGFPLLGIPVTSILSYIFVILYIMGPIEIVMNSIPGLTQSNISLESIERIREKAEKIIEEIPEQQNKFDFQRLDFKQVEFAYEEDNDERQFRVGPIDFQVGRGNMVFIVGGNGSGKTTFFKLLTGLYKAQKGEIQIDGTRVAISDYRSLFSPIFSDFYLFDTLYGMEHGVSEKRVTELLQQMQLEHKVSYEDSNFSTVSLSTGQRKRLALIIALLEEKPILVLDEWAADQDPQFRQFFYENLLPELRKKDVTIIAITHDDKYFHVADKVYKMDEGTMSEISEQAKIQKAL
ncbi:MAG: cyclic peptide export ABC transporter [Bacteroidetes bacterium]|nr:MAG: cyclic peptide export ABC transporter [Bacteroidota bacterium]